jgi:hypothetical protein
MLYALEQRVFLYDTYVNTDSLERVGEHFDVNNSPFGE